MEAKKLAEHKKWTVNGVVEYRFSEPGFVAFCKQLCKEQREICMESVSEDDMYHDTTTAANENLKDIQKIITNASEPEI